jgi:hypothetical protein
LRDSESLKVAFTALNYFQSTCGER